MEAYKKYSLFNFMVVDVYINWFIIWGIEIKSEQWYHLGFPRKMNVYTHIDTYVYVCRCIHRYTHNRFLWDCFIKFICTRRNKEMERERNIYVYIACVCNFFSHEIAWLVKIHRVVEKLEYTGKSWCYNLVSKTILEAEDFPVRVPNT